MSYIVKARFYAEKDSFGESYVVTSDNSGVNTHLEVGSSVELFNADKSELEESPDNNTQQLKAEICPVCKGEKVVPVPGLAGYEFDEDCYKCKGTGKLLLT